MEPKLIDNITTTLKDDLTEEIKSGSKLSIAAACFSMYAYRELKAQLESIDELRFIFTSPTFTHDRTKKEKREFYIPKLDREKSLYGTEFEVRLRNELSQRSIAKECAEWIRQKVKFKSNISTERIPGFINVDDINYSNINEFTTVDLGCERGNNAFYGIMKNGAPNSTYFLNMFDSLWNSSEKMQDVTEEIIENISTAYNENAPDFIYFFTLYNIFHEFLDDISEDVLPNEANGFKESCIWKKLYNFQKDAVLAIINKLETYNGCILADSVGLGKTFTALAVIKYYENRNKNVLVLCPKKLANNWNTYNKTYINNTLISDRLRYDVLFHTDLGRDHGSSNGLDLSYINWANYDLVVIDESHNFRNGGKIDQDDDEDEKINRYTRLMNQVIRRGVKTKVLMLSATPVNTKFNDLKNQLQLAYEGNSSEIDSKLNTKRSIDEIFRLAQKSFNAWSKLKPEERTTDSLLKRLDFDFFEVLDSVTIARSRKHIQKYYDTADIGTFPRRLVPLSKRPELTNLDKAITYNEIFALLDQLNLEIYRPSSFIQSSKLSKYTDIYDREAGNLTQANRENGIRKLMAINLMKRMESSVYSFRLTVTRIYELIKNTIGLIDDYGKHIGKQFEFEEIDFNDLDTEDQDSEDIFTFGKKVKIDLADMDRTSWRSELVKDMETLGQLVRMINEITPKYDSKLRELLLLIKGKIENPINPGNKKIIIFTAFSDTAEYLYKYVSQFVTNAFGLHTALVTGTGNGKTTAKLKYTDINRVLTCFSPISKEKELLEIDDPEIDVLIATDCISEGQNLQDCDYLINYDIHWNPVRIIQRFGRIDRIGSQNECIQLVNFWPNVSLDSYINLKGRVESRMKIVNMTATGDDNILDQNEKNDLEYRRAQLERLQREVVDIEEMSTGISIMDLGLNEFRLDLLEYIKQHPDIEKAPFGLHSVTQASEDDPHGVIFVLKNRSDSVNIDNQNRLHPFYMVYITVDGEVVCDHLSPKNMLDKMRFLCKGKTEPIPQVYRAFNKETDDGKNMSRMSKLLGDAISSIISVKEESDIDAFLNGSAVSFKNEIKGLDDFELICFLVVR